MDVQRTFTGVEVTLTSRGRGRSFSVLFLVCWLVFWAAGEAFVFWILIAGAKALFTGLPLEHGRKPLDPGPAPVMGLFLLARLAFWTVGGIAAGRELTCQLWSRDLLRITCDRIEIRRRRCLVCV